MYQMSLLARLALIIILGGNLLVSKSLFPDSRGLFSFVFVELME